MIPCDQPAHAASDELRRHLLETWSAGGGGPVPPRVQEAAAAVAAYCVQEIGPRGLSDRHLSLLFSRALLRAGEGEAARRLLGHDAEDVERESACLAALDRLAAPWPVVDWFARRVCRPSSFVAFGEGACWTLDWARLQATSGPPLEVAYAGLLDRMITDLAPLWDATQGRGTLCHIGLDRHFSGVAGLRTAARGVWARDVCERSRDLLARESARRGWTQVPDCRLLDSAY